MSGVRQRYVELFKDRALKFGDFTLSSGAKSTYYMDARQMFFGEALGLIGAMLRTHLNAVNRVDAIGGLETGAISMTAALLQYTHSLPGFSCNNCEGFYVRKEAKKHGTGSLIEGRVKAGDRVMIVDDVLTTGASALKAIEAVEAVGAEVVLVSCIVDRLQGAAEALKKYTFWPLFNITDFGIPAPAV